MYQDPICGFHKHTHGVQSYLHLVPFFAKSIEVLILVTLYNIFMHLSVSLSSCVSLASFTGGHVSGAVTAPVLVTGGLSADMAARGEPVAAGESARFCFLHKEGFSSSDESLVRFFCGVLVASGSLLGLHNVVMCEYNRAGYNRRHTRVAVVEEILEVTMAELIHMTKTHCSVVYEANGHS